MPQFEHDSTSLYFEEHGRGFPILCFAPGAMNSIVELWENATLNPLSLYTDAFRVIAMDQRNAGRSHGPLDLADPWGSYARDQLALMDQLGIDRFLVMGCCIGGSFALKLMEVASDRVAAAVLEQPVGIADGNERLYDQMWRSWGERLVHRQDLTPEAVEEFGVRMWQGDFVVSVTRDAVGSCQVPMLVLPGTDRYHPTAIGREIAALAPSGEVLEPWNDSPRSISRAASAVGAFLATHAH